MWKADEYHSASDNTEPPLIKSYEHVLNTTALAILPSSSSSLSLQDLVLGWVGTPVDFTLKRLFKKIHHLGEVTFATSKNFESRPLSHFPLQIVLVELVQRVWSGRRRFPLSHWLLWLALTMNSLIPYDFLLGNVWRADTCLVSLFHS